MTGGFWGWGNQVTSQRRKPRCGNLKVMKGGWSLGSPALLSLSPGAFEGQTREELRSRGLFPQPHRELEHQASGPMDPSPQPQGPSLLMLQALQELDLTACSKLTDASLAQVWDWGCG